MKVIIEKGTIELCRTCECWRIYLDISTGKAFVCEYADRNSWTEFRNENIVEIMAGTGNTSIFGFSGVNRLDIIEAAERRISEIEAMKRNTA